MPFDFAHSERQIAGQRAYRDGLAAENRGDAPVVALLIGGLLALVAGVVGVRSISARRS